MGRGTIEKKLILGVDAQKFRSQMQRVDANIHKVSRSFRNLGAAFGAAFAIGHIQQFTKEAIQLGGQLQKARAGFARFGNEADLQALRDATMGLTSDLELMQQAVKGANLGIPLQQMAKFLGFAKRRADETGESLDYMINSIVEGIGRKSLRRIDNLGITADRIKEKLGGMTLEMASVADMARIMGEVVDEDMSKMGAPIRTAADDMERLAVAWKNFTAKLGEGIAPAAVKTLETLEGVAAVFNAFYNPSERTRMIEFENERARMNKRLREWQEKKGYTRGAASKIRPAWYRKGMEAIDRRQYPFKYPPAPAEAETAPTKPTEPQFFDPVQQIAIFNKGLQDMSHLGKDAEASMALLSQTVDSDLAEAMKEQIAQMEKYVQTMQLAESVGQEFGHMLNAAFLSAMQGQEDFFESFEKSIKSYMEKMMASLAITLTLSALITSFSGGAASFAQIFRSIGQSAGLGGAIQIYGAISGTDLKVSNQRQNYLDILSGIGG